MSADAAAMTEVKAPSSGVFKNVFRKMDPRLLIDEGSLSEKVLTPPG